jgi:diaminopimelate epimerase
MPPLNLTKHHGLGNDFLVLLDPPSDIDLARLAVRLCDRRRGIGADGLIAATRPPEAEGDIVMHLRNADGSRAEMSGNGIRCLAQAVVDAGWVAGNEFAVHTDAGLRHLVVHPETEPGLRQVTVDMGPVTIGRSDDRSASVDTGNPHLVLLVDDPASVDLLELGRRHPELNVEVIAPGPEPDALTFRVHERGAGITEACGTGSCAAAAAARRWGLVGTSVIVHNPGGDVIVDLKPETALLTGPAQLIGEVSVRP